MKISIKEVLYKSILFFIVMVIYENTLYLHKCYNKYKRGVIIMETNYMAILFTIINILLIVFIGIGIFKCVKWLRNFVNKVEKLDKKMDDVLKKL
ncbi:hypothetical protein DVW02_02735 [Clostridium botulinum]|nr:hypothetical protein [Clostridium botulinum]